MFSSVEGNLTAAPSIMTAAVLTLFVKVDRVTKRGDNASLAVQLDLTNDPTI